MEEAQEDTRSRVKMLTAWESLVVQEDTRSRVKTLTVLESLEDMAVKMRMFSTSKFLQMVETPLVATTMTVTMATMVATANCAPQDITPNPSD